MYQGSLLGSFYFQIGCKTLQHLFVLCISHLPLLPFFSQEIFLWITGNKAGREQTLPFLVCGVPGLSLKAHGVSPDCQGEGMPFPEEIKQEDLKIVHQHWHLLLSFLRFVFRKHNLLKILKSGQNITWEKSIWCQWASLTQQHKCLAWPVAMLMISVHWVLPADAGILPTGKNKAQQNQTKTKQPNQNEVNWNLSSKVIWMQKKLLAVVYVHPIEVSAVVSLRKKMYLIILFSVFLSAYC